MGAYSHSIDAKGRIILPADFRQELGLAFIITKGLDHCLFLYGQQAWEELAAKLRTLPLAKPEARALSRFFFQGHEILNVISRGGFSSLRIFVSTRDLSVRAMSSLRARMTALRFGTRSCGIRTAAKSNRMSRRWLRLFRIFPFDKADRAA